MKKYTDERWCPFCKKETVQEVEDSQHERDSSYDSKKCTVCGAFWMGMGDNYSLTVDGVHEERGEWEGRP